MRLLTRIVNRLALRVPGPPEPCGMVGLFTSDGLPPRLGTTPASRPEVTAEVAVSRAAALGALKNELRQQGVRFKDDDDRRQFACGLLFVRWLRGRGRFAEYGPDAQIGVQEAARTIRVRAGFTGEPEGVGEL